MKGRAMAGKKKQDERTGSESREREAGGTGRKGALGSASLSAVSSTAALPPPPLSPPNTHTRKRTRPQGSLEAGVGAGPHQGGGAQVELLQILIQQHRPCTHSRKAARPGRQSLTRDKGGRICRRARSGRLLAVRQPRPRRPAQLGTRWGCLPNPNTAFAARIPHAPSRRHMATAPFPRSTRTHTHTQTAHLPRRGCLRRSGPAGCPSGRRCGTPAGRSGSCESAAMHAGGRARPASRTSSQQHPIHPPHKILVSGILSSNLLTALTPRKQENCCATRISTLRLPPAIPPPPCASPARRGHRTRFR